MVLVHIWVQWAVVECMNSEDDYARLRAVCRACNTELVWELFVWCRDHDIDFSDSSNDERAALPASLNPRLLNDDHHL